MGAEQVSPPRLRLHARPGGIAALLDETVAGGSVALAWLGQAGFLLKHGNVRLLIDPYLSDHLGKKYAGTRYTHQRMMPPPIAAETIRDLTLVLCTHRHGDHMDPLTLPVLARNNPQCRFVVPRAEIDSARAIGLAPERLLLVNAGETLRIGQAISIEVLASAHEQLKVNDRGEHHFLGYILRLGGRTIYHSGDCVVYDGLAEKLAASKVDLALLPVNGRREELTRHGVIGNMSFAEAVELCLSATIGAMIGHHIGMFDFNTVEPVELRRQIANVDSARLDCVLAALDSIFALA